MLYPIVLRRVVPVLAMGVLCAAASAQNYPSNMQGAALSPAEKANLAKLTQEIEAQAIRGAEDPRMQAQTAHIARQIDSIANPHLASARAKILRFLGINPESPNAVYIFVSWSMPLNELRAYEVDAMWTGATLVFKGVPPGVSLLDFLTKDLRKLVWDKGAAADISIDPRLFDAYGIKVVPTIVLSATRQNFLCAGEGKRAVTVNGHTATYSLCPAVPEKDYIKLSGAVTVDYALRQFQDNGWAQAGPFLAALRKGYPNGFEATEEQKPFQGKWQSAYTPEKLMLNGPESRPGATAPSTGP